MGTFKYSLHKPCSAKNLPNRCCHAKRREAGQQPAAGQQGRPAMHQRWSKAHTSFGDSCVHAWKVNNKPLKSACFMKIHRNSSIIQAPGSGQAAEVLGCFPSTLPLMSPSSYMVSDNFEAFWLLQSSSCLFTLFASWPWMKTSSLK